MTMKRILLICSAAVILLVGVVLLVVSSRIDSYRPQIQSQIQQKLNRPVTLGHLSLKLFPLAVKVDWITIQEDPAFHATRPFATANQVDVSVGFFSLLSGSPDIKSLTLDQPKIELIRNAGGAWNFATLGNQKSDANSDSSLKLARLKIDDGEIGLTDEQQKQARSVYNHIDVDLAGFAPHKEFSLDLGAHLAGEGKQSLKFSGKVGPINAANTAATPVKGHVTLDELTLSGLNRLSPGAIPAGDDGQATGEADVSTENNRLLCKGSLKVDNAVVSGEKLGFPVSARYDFDADRSSNAVNVKSGSVGLGQTSFDVNGVLNAGSKPAGLNMHVVTKNSSIAELGRLASTFHVLSNPAYQMKGTLSADLTATGTTDAPLLNGTVNTRGLEVSGGEIQQPVRLASLDLTLSPQKVQSSPFTAQSGSTALDGQFTMINYAQKTRAIDATLKTNNANLAELLNMAKAYGVDASNGAKATGSLSLNLHVQGPLENLSGLTFNGNAGLKNGTLESPSLTKPVAVKNADVQFSQNKVALSNLSSTVGSTSLNGNLSVQNFSTPQVQFALAADKIDVAGMQHLVKTEGTTPKANGGAHQPSILTKTSGSGTLAAGTIRAEQIVLSNFKANCTLDKGVIRLSPVTTDLFGGKETGTITYDSRPADGAVALNVKLAGVDTNALLSAVSSVKGTLTGSLAADANVSFTLASSTDAIARSLNGPLSFNVTNGQLKNVNILNEISKVGKFLQAAPSGGGNNTDLKKLSGTMDIRNGVATSNNLAAVLDAGSLSAQGALNLVDQGLNMRVNAVLGQSTSQSVGGSGIGGYLNTALANNKGELVLPVIVTGTTSHPVFAPDVQALAKMKLSNLLPTSGDPTKLTSGIIGAVSGKGGAGNVVNQILGGGQNNKPDDKNSGKDAVNSILQQFGRKKPKQ